VPWQASAERAHSVRRGRTGSAMVDLPVTLDDSEGDDIVADVPRSFDPKARSFTGRRVRHTWVQVQTSLRAANDAAGAHDPFALLRW
jgi:CRISPR system Cascade subunit CasD